MSDLTFVRGEKWILFRHAHMHDNYNQYDHSFRIEDHVDYDISRAFINVLRIRAELS